ncbi:hypothetical protein KOR42_06970 [Thalassoglobus neptunius]|uniref:Uncharacterized protein n=1 Tax=Thalassoglobus neptunius TaxID=1938619 RepID=A0A5C5X2Q8_9PLAN|nr:hypothetical protein KOR42_06970 [Thalassoglobus neptunius]
MLVRFVVGMIRVYRAHGRDSNWAEEILKLSAMLAIRSVVWTLVNRRTDSANFANP